MKRGTSAHGSSRGSSRAATRAASRPSRSAPSRAKPAARPASKPAPKGSSRPTSNRATAQALAKPVKPSRPPTTARSSKPPTKPAKAAKPKPPTTTKAPKRTQRPRLKRYDEGGLVDEGGGGPSGSREVYVGMDAAGNHIYQNRATGARRTVPGGGFNPNVPLDTSQIEDRRPRTRPVGSVATGMSPARRDDVLTDVRDKALRRIRRRLPGR